MKKIISSQKTTFNNDEPKTPPQSQTKTKQNYNDQITLIQSPKNPS
jgi:hypothetical protein